MIPRVPVLVLASVLLAATSLHAENRPVHGSVLVIVQSTGEEDQEFRSLMLNVIRVEIEDRELEMVEPRTAPPEGEKPWDSARLVDAEFALVGTYAVKEGEATLYLAWYDTAEREQIQAVSRKVGLDFTLDVAIAAAVAEILEGQKDRIAAVRSARAEADRVAAEKAAAEKSAAEKAAAEKAAAEKAAAEKAAAEKAAAEKAAIEKAASERAQAEAERKLADALTRPVRRWGLFAAGAPFLATVESSEYFTLGLSVAVNGQYRFPLPGGLFGIGLATGVQRFRATGTAGEADSTLVPLGVTFTYGTNTVTRFDFFAHVDGGAALFILQPIGGTAAMGVVPYALGGVGMTFAVFEKAGFIIDASYAAFFPRGVPIMGFSPSLGLFVRF